MKSSIILIFSFLFKIILSIDEKEDLNLYSSSSKINSHLCQNKWANSSIECYLLDPSTSENICSMYHVSLKRKKFGLDYVEDYSKCQELSPSTFNKEGIESLKEKEKNLYKEKIEILSFGLAASGHNFCTEYSYQDTTRSQEKTKNFCRQAKIFKGGNKCCYIHVDGTMGGEKNEDNRCMEIESDTKADELVDLIVNRVEKDGAINVNGDYECFDVEEAVYNNYSNNNNKRSSSNYLGLYLKNINLNLVVMILLFLA